MATKLFVGGLPYSVTDEELQSAFAGVGNVVSAKVITDRESGRSKGFGFVEMESDDEAKTAVEQLNGSDMSGRSISVSEARPKEEGGRRDFGGNRGGGNGGSGGGSFRQRENRY
jgi:RNA recognition motif-containing protein